METDTNQPTKQQYVKWKTTINESSSTEYWSNFYHYSHYIYEDIMFNTQSLVSQELHIAQPKLSTLLPLLKQIYMINTPIEKLNFIEN